MLKVVEAHPYLFLMGELLRAFEDMSPPTGDEVHSAFVISLYRFYQLWDTDPSLGIPELSKKLMFHRLPADIRTFQKVCVIRNAAP